MPKDPQHAEFCKILVEARKTSGLTQIELAVRLGKPQSFVSKYESGERGLHVVEFISVCDALHVNPAELIEAFKERK
jgi:transcriptional regulator with XRE-family HTH domain